MLESIYSVKAIGSDWDKNCSLLYQLLGERKSYESISHNDMPTWKEHEEFVRRKPYKGWYIIHEDLNAEQQNIPVGSIYLSHKNEIGIAIFEKYRKMGFASKAIKELIRLYYYEKYFYANINPMNEKSINLFKKLKFELLQQTYIIEGKKHHDVS